MSVKEPELSLSFVDLLSCSLGAMILLFLIFATMSHDGSEESQRETGVPLESIDAGTTNTDTIQPATPQLFEVILKTQDGTDSLTLVAQNEKQLVQPLKVESSDTAGSGRFLVWIPVDQQQESLKFQVKPPISSVAVEVYRLTVPHEQQIKPVMSDAKVVAKEGQPAIEFWNGQWKTSDTSN